MKKDTNIVFFIISTGIIFVLFLLFQPKILAKIFGKRNTILVNRFIAASIQSKKIDVQEFWKMREFYCPGSFTLDKAKNPFLVYSCKWLRSEDYLTTSSILTNDYPLDPKYVLLQTSNILLYKTNQKLSITFIVSGDEMKKAVGVFDYLEKDKELVKNKYWLDKTIIQL